MARSERGLTALGLALALALGACGGEDERGPNGSPCLKDKDCASDRCVATTCQVKPVFEAAAGAAGAADE